MISDHICNPSNYFLSSKFLLKQVFERQIRGAKSLCHGALYNRLMNLNVEPTLITSRELMGILEELKSREPIFHRPELGTTRADFENMTVSDFWEVGASGSRYSRDHVLDVLEQRYGSGQIEDLQTEDFHCRQLGEDVYLLTYTLFQDGRKRKTRRATIWQHTETGWKIVFHQGTIVQDS